MTVLEVSPRHGGGVLCRNRTTICAGGGGAPPAPISFKDGMVSIFFAGSQAGILRTDGKRGRRIRVGVEGGGGCSEGEAGNHRGIRADSRWGAGLCFRPRVQQDSADSCVLTVHGDYPGWCEESCCGVGSVPPD